MDFKEWQRISSAQWHVIAGRDELVSGSNDFDTAYAVAVSTSAARKRPVQLIDSHNPGSYLRFWSGREVENLLK